MKKYEIMLPEDLQLDTLNIIAGVRAANREKEEKAKFIRRLRKTMYSRIRKVGVVSILIAAVTLAMRFDLMDSRVSIALLAVLLVVIGWIGAHACNSINVYRRFL